MTDYIRSIPELSVYQSADVVPQITHEQATALTTAIKDGLRQISKQFIEIGRYLLFGYEHGAHSVLGLSFPEWCELDISLKRSTAYALMQIARLVEQYPSLEERVVELGVSKSELLVARAGWDSRQGKYAKSEDEIVELIDTAKEMTCRDFKRGVKEDEQFDIAYVTCTCGCNRTLKLTLTRGARVIKTEVMTGNAVWESN